MHKIKLQVFNNVINDQTMHNLTADYASMAGRVINYAFFHYEQEYFTSITSTQIGSEYKRTSQRLNFVLWLNIYTSDKIYGDLVYDFLSGVIAERDSQHEPILSQHWFDKYHRMWRRSIQRYVHWCKSTTYFETPLLWDTKTFLRRYNV